METTPGNWLQSPEHGFSFNSTENDNFTTNTSGESSDESFLQTLQRIWPIVIPITCVAVAGNLVVLHAVCAVERFRQSGNFMLANLSFASLLSMANLLFIIFQYKGSPLVPFGPKFCKLFPGLTSSPAAAEGFTMVLLSLDRTRMARKPLENEGRGEMIRKIALIWLAALALDMPKGFLFWTYDQSRDAYHMCVNRKELFGREWPYVSYMIAHFLISAILPCLILLRDFRRMTGQLRFLILTEVRTIAGRKYHKDRLKLIRNALIFTAIFILTKIPEGLYSLLLHYPQDLLPTEAYRWLRSWRKIYYSLACLRFFFYPLIIFALSTEIRKYIFCCCCNQRGKWLRR